MVKLFGGTRLIAPLLGAALFMAACQSLPPGPEADFLDFLSQLEDLPEARRGAYLDALWDLHTERVTLPVRQGRRVTWVVRGASEPLTLLANWLAGPAAFRRLGGTDLARLDLEVPDADELEYRLNAAGQPWRDRLNPLSRGSGADLRHLLRRPGLILEDLGADRPGNAPGRLSPDADLPGGALLYIPARPPAPGSPILLVRLGPGLPRAAEMAVVLDTLLARGQIEPHRVWFLTPEEIRSVPIPGPGKVLALASGPGAAAWAAARQAQALLWIDPRPETGVPRKTWLEVPRLAPGGAGLNGPWPEGARVRPWPYAPGEALGRRVLAEVLPAFLDPGAEGQ